jgi:hypothetical protein
MFKISVLCGALLAGSIAAPALAQDKNRDSNRTAGSAIVVAEYMRAVPNAPTSVPRCRRVCTKTAGGTQTHEGHCVQWQTVCS